MGRYLLLILFVASIGCGKETPKAEIPTNPAPPPQGPMGAGGNMKNKADGKAAGLESIQAPP